jgi:hypothetical protein
MTTLKATVTTGSPNRNKIGYKIPAIVGIVVALVFIVVMIAVRLNGHSSPPSSKQETTSVSDVQSVPAISAVSEAPAMPLPSRLVVHIPAASEGKPSLPVPVPLGAGLCLGLTPETDGFTRDYHNRISLNLEDDNWHPVDSSNLATTSNGERYWSLGPAKDMEVFYVHAGQACS